MTKYELTFKHPITGHVLDTKMYDTLNDIADDLKVSRHVIYRFMNNKISDRYKKSCVLSHIDIRTHDDKITRV